MEHIPQLIFDLALLLFAAAIATVVCRKLKQPLILGYVLAGFLISPAINWTPGVGDSESISTWSEIGVIFLMFGLGLEFSIMKLVRVGRPGVITALTEMILIISAGLLCGTLLGWSFLTSLFLGGTLAISSTTIIVKAFGELGLKEKKFTELVFGSLIIEDIAGIFLMIILSSVAIGSAIDGGAMAIQIGQMALYLLVWFVLSVLLIPTLLKKVSHIINDEIMLISSVALCLIMVTLANSIGFSAALGAFMAGSILAGTVKSKQIEELFKPMKDFFGAIFFVSVGMLVSPQMIVDNIVPILAITVVVLVGKPLFTAIGALLSKQTLKTSVQTGLSLSQIGEFSFIIAALGVSLGVTADFLYPVIVAVSVVTTITTPVFIKNTEKVYSVINKIIPQTILNGIEKRTRSSQEQSAKNIWADYIKHWLVKVLMLAIATIASVVLLSELGALLLFDPIPQIAIEIASVSIELAIIGVFASNLFHIGKKADFGLLLTKNRTSRLVLVLLMFLSLNITLALIIYVFLTHGSFQHVWIIIPALLLTILFLRSKRAHSTFLKFENLFIRNLNEGTLAEAQPIYDDEKLVDLVASQLHIVTVTASHWRKYKNRVVSIDLVKARACNLDLLSIKRKGEDYHDSILSFLDKEELFIRLNNPEDDLHLCEGDELTFLGSEQEAAAFIHNMDKTLNVNEQGLLSTALSELLINDGSFKAYQCFRIMVNPSSYLRRKTIKDSRLKEDHGCLVVAIEHKALFTLKPSSNTRIAANDYIWVIGRANDAQVLLDEHAGNSKEERVNTSNNTVDSQKERWG